MTDASSPRLSVVLCTFRRPDSVGRALAGLLASSTPDLEVVVADAGDAEETAAALAHLRDDPRWRIVPVPDLGLARLRNDGAAHAHGSWIAFLDDDDWVEDEWCDAMLEVAGRPGIGLVSCGAELVDPGSGRREPAPTADLGPLFGHVTGNVLAGCWTVRRDVFDHAGGYLPGLMWSHQTELWLRLVPTCRELGLAVASVDRTLTNVSRRPPSERRLAHPQLLLDGTRWILARHAETFRDSPADLATYLDIVGVNAARLGEWRIARRSFVRSLLAGRSAPRAARVAVSMVPPVARRVWHGPPGGARDARLAGQALAAVATSDDEPSPDSVFLPWRYRENEPASADRDGTPFWASDQFHDDRYQVPVYRWAARLARDPRHRPVVDVGCGSGRKLVDIVGSVTDQVVGVDQGSGIQLARDANPDLRWVTGDLDDEEVWAGLRPLAPGLVVCSDVVEHVTDPARLLQRLRDFAAGAPILLSTPDRSRLEGIDPDGPPRNPAHIREWTADELELLCESVGLSIVRARRLLPRAYSPTRTDVNRVAYRALHRMPVPDRRSSLALLLRPARG